MELRHLRYFLAVAEEHHFGRAAQRLHIAQSPLSQQILALERELGTQLFYRTPHGTHLTPAGQVLLPRARQVLALVAETTEAIRQRGQKAQYLLRLGLCESGNPAILMALCRALRERNSNYVIETEYVSTPARMENLQRHRYDAAVLLNLSALPRGWRQQQLHRERLYAAIPAHHRLAGIEVVDLREVGGDLLLPSWLDAPSNGKRSSGEHGSSGGSAPDRLTVEARLELVAAGAAITVVLESYLERFHLDDVVYRPVAAPLASVQWSLVWLAEQESRPIFQQMIRELDRLCDTPACTQGESSALLPPSPAVRRAEGNGPASSPEAGDGLPGGSKIVDRVSGHGPPLGPRKARPAASEPVTKDNLDNR